MGTRKCYPQAHSPRSSPFGAIDESSMSHSKTGPSYGRVWSWVLHYLPVVETLSQEADIKLGPELEEHGGVLEQAEKSSTPEVSAQDSNRRQWPLKNTFIEGSGKRHRGARCHERFDLLDASVLGALRALL